MEWKGPNMERKGLLWNGKDQTWKGKVCHGMERTKHGKERSVMEWKKGPNMERKGLSWNGKDQTWKGKVCHGMERTLSIPRQTFPFCGLNCMYSQPSISQSRSSPKATDISKQIFWSHKIYFEILVVWNNKS